MNYTNKCSNCGSTAISGSRDIGCLIFIIIFISFGLGIILIPFLPKKYVCRTCGVKWKV